MSTNLSDIYLAIDTLRTFDLITQQLTYLDNAPIASTNLFKAVLNFTINEIDNDENLERLKIWSIESLANVDIEDLSNRLNIPFRKCTLLHNRMADLILEAHGLTADLDNYPNIKLRELGPINRLKPIIKSFHSTHLIVKKLGTCIYTSELKTCNIQGVEMVSDYFQIIYQEQHIKKSLPLGGRFFETAINLDPVEYIKFMNDAGVDKTQIAIEFLARILREPEKEYLTNNSNFVTECLGVDIKLLSEQIELHSILGIKDSRESATIIINSLQANKDHALTECLSLPTI